ncbi:MAG: DinB family protein [Thermoanaerobaculum sp.]
MISSLEALLGFFDHEARITARVFEALTDASLAQRVTDKDRSLGEMAWHMVTSIPEMFGHLGLQLPGPGHHDPVPATARELTEAYRKVSRAALAAMRASWTDASLGDTHEIYGYRWTKAETVLALLLHQTHHRGAMTVLMRQAGLRLPEIYGPSRDTEARDG